MKSSQYKVYKYYILGSAVIRWNFYCFWAPNYNSGVVCAVFLVKYESRSLIRTNELGPVEGLN